eukprot:1839439-Prymnesium_polylepis.1
MRCCAYPARAARITASAISGWSSAAPATSCASRYCRSRSGTGRRGTLRSARNSAQSSAQPPAASF